MFLNDEVKRKIRLAYELVKYSKKVKYIPKRASILKKREYTDRERQTT